MSDFTDRELGAVTDAKAHLRAGDPHRALASLQLGAMPADPPIAAGLAMPTWNAGTGAWPVLATTPPLLDLLEVSHV